MPTPPASEPRAPEGARWKLRGWEPFEGLEQEKLKPYLDKISTLTASLKDLGDARTRLSSLVQSPDTNPVGVTFDRLTSGRGNRDSDYVFQDWSTAGLYFWEGSLKFDEPDTPTYSTCVLPDIGAFENVLVTEILVKPGQSIAKDQSIVTIESDKAAMEIPSLAKGIVDRIHLTVGNRISAGSPILSFKEEPTGTPVEPPPAGKIFCKGSVVCTIGNPEGPLKILAPFDGVFAAVVAKPGQRLNEGDTLCTMRPFTTPSVSLEISRSIDKYLTRWAAEVQTSRDFFAKRGVEERQKTDKKFLELSRDVSTYKLAFQNLGIASAVTVAVLLAMVTLLYLDHSLLATLLACAAVGLGTGVWFLRRSK